MTNCPLMPGNEVSREVVDREAGAELQQVHGRRAELAHERGAAGLIEPGVVGEVRAVDPWRRKRGDEVGLAQVLVELQRDRELRSVRLEVVGDELSGERRCRERDVRRYRI